MHDAHRTLASDTSPAVEALQLRIWREKPIEERIALSGSFCDGARSLAEVGVRRRYPLADEAEVRLRTAATWLDRETMHRCYGWDPLSPTGAAPRAILEGFPPASRRPASAAVPQSPDHVLVALLAGERLDAAGVVHMVCGSIASSIHGEPRTTVDVDFVVVAGVETMDRLRETLEPDFFVDPELLRFAVEHQLAANVIHLRTAIKVDLFLVRPRQFSRVELSRRVRQRVQRDPDRFLWIARPEDTLLSKLEWYHKDGEVSDQQWRDVLGLVRLQGEALELAYVDRWSAELGVADLWARVRPGPPSNA